MEDFIVTVTLRVEALSHAAASIMVEDAIREKCKAKMDCRSPERVYLDSLNVVKAKPRK